MAKVDWIKAINKLWQHSVTYSWKASNINGVEGIDKSQSQGKLQFLDRFYDKPCAIF